MKGSLVSSRWVVATVLGLSLVASGCGSSDEPAAVQTSASASAAEPSPTVTVDGSALLAEALTATRAAGGVGVTATVRVDLPDGTSQTVEFLGVMDVTTGDAEGTLNVNGLEQERRIVEGMGYTRASDGSWLEEPVRRGGLVGGDVLTFWESVAALESPVSWGMDRADALTGYMPADQALRHSGVSDDVYATLVEDVTSSPAAAVDILMDASRLITGVEQRLKVSSETLGDVVITTTVFLRDYGQVVTPQRP